MEKYFANLTNSIINKNNNKKLITHFVTLILSKHLYISFLIFFSPYLLKLFTYLYPLFITTSLLLLSLFTTLAPLDSIVNSKQGFFTTSYVTLLNILHHHKDDDEDEKMQLVQVYEAYNIMFETEDMNPFETSLFSRNEFEETLVWFWKDNVQYGSNVDVKEKKLESYVSDNVSNEERMDLLWETYESEEEKKGKRQEKIKELMMISDNLKVNYGDNDEENNENENLCCLKALKLSAGKMNLSMGRSSLVRFGKVFKGIGWLEKHGRRKHAKKG